jgi:nitrite reductase/ring-hydroxylating ferredoxin subunit
MFLRRWRGHLAKAQAASADSAHSVNLGRVADFPPLGPFLTEIDGVHVVVSRTRRAYVAFARRCPHLGADLAAAAVTSDCVVCPLHGNVYSLRDGRRVRGRAGSGQRLSVINVEVVDGTLVARMPSFHPAMSADLTAG